MSKIARKLMGVTKVANAFALNFIGTADDSSDATSHTYSNVNIGTASSDRIVIVVAHATGGTSIAAITGITLGGASMTSAVAADSSFRCSSIHYLEVSSGTTANIVVSYASTRNRGTIAVYTLTGWSSSTPSDTNTVNATGVPSVPLSANIPTGSVAVYGFTAPGSTVTCSYSDATETYDKAVGTETTTASGAYLYDAGSGHTETITTSASVNSTFIVAVWG